MTGTGKSLLLAAEFRETIGQASPFLEQNVSLLSRRSRIPVCIRHLASSLGSKNYWVQRVDPGSDLLGSREENRSRFNRFPVPGPHFVLSGAIYTPKIFP